MASDNDHENDHTTSQETRKPVFFFKQTQEAARNNSQILAAFNGNLGAAIEAQKVIPLDYG